MAGYGFRFWFGEEISLLVVVCWLLNPITKPYRISKPKPMAKFFLILVLVSAIFAFLPFMPSLTS